MGRRPSMSLLTAGALAVVAIAVSMPPGRAAPATTQSQTQTCPPVDKVDPDPVTLAGPAALWPPNHKLQSYGITASETAAEKNDGLPHGVTISYTITTIDTPGGEGSPSNGPDATPPAGSASGDFTTTAFFQLRAERSGPGTGRTYRIDWMASFDGSMGMSLHRCSSTDGSHHPFTVTVAHDRRS